MSLIKSSGVLQNAYRTLRCGDCNKNMIGKDVVLSGWLQAKRNHGGVLFLELRDYSGFVQLVVDVGIADCKSVDLELLARTPLESVLKINGLIRLRDAGTERKDIETGLIEVVIKSFSILSRAYPSKPFNVTDEKSADVKESTRLTYRFLDLRRKKMHDRIIMRNKLLNWVRNKLFDMNFTEIQTPILTSCSPEGARDFLAPARMEKGKYYALPQAPQQFKQMSMVSGFDRYFQIAPCFRNEDARADRYMGEFYQIDVEMAFVEQEDVLSTFEPFFVEMFKKFGHKKVSDKPFERILYADAMLKYGSDKPDLRNPIVNFDVTDIFADSGFSIFANAIKKGACVRAIPAPNTFDKPRSFFDDMIEFAIKNGSKGLAYIVFDKDGASKGPIAKLLTEEQLKKIMNVCGLKNGDSVFFSCDSVLPASKIAGAVRVRIGELLNLIDDSSYKFCWVYDFPFLEIHSETGAFDFSHNPFSQPSQDLVAICEEIGFFNGCVLSPEQKERLLNVRSKQYDIVCDGFELSSGAIRNSDIEQLYKAFEIVGYSRSIVDEKFSGILRAFKFGVPPHGGIAPGFDRILMLLSGERNIRDVYMFPLNSSGDDLLMGAPSFIDKNELSFMGVKVDDSVMSNEDKIFYAATSGDDAIMQSVLKSDISVDVRDKRGRSPIFYAVLNENVNCAKMLIDAGADLMSCDKENCSSIILMSSLYKKGFVDKLNVSNELKILLFAYCGEFEKIKQMLELDAKLVNSCDSLSRNVLMYVLIGLHLQPAIFRDNYKEIISTAGVFEKLCEAVFKNNGRVLDFIKYLGDFFKTSGVDIENVKDKDGDNYVAYFLGKSFGVDNMRCNWHLNTIQNSAMDF